MAGTATTEVVAADNAREAATVLPHVRVGDGCLVGAGAVVIKDVRSGQTVFGNPAKVLKF